jgi:hypothetical protein
MRPFHHPAPRLVPRLPLPCLRLFATRAHMGREGELRHQLPDVVVVIALVQTQTLLLAGFGQVAMDRDAAQRRLDQLLVVAVGPVDGQADREAVGLDQQAALGPEFAPVGGVFARLFPPRAEPWSWPRPAPTSASPVPATGHTPPALAPRVSRRRPPRPIPESGGAPSSWNRCRWPSGRPTGSRCGARRRWHPWPADRARAGCDSRGDAACGAAGAVRGVATASRGCASRHRPRGRQSLFCAFGKSPREEFLALQLDSCCCRQPLPTGIGS